MPQPLTLSTIQLRTFRIVASRYLWAELGAQEKPETKSSVRNLKDN